MNQALNLIVYRAITEIVLILKELPVVKGCHIYKADDFFCFRQPGIPP